ncbi:uncharacterized protein LOC135086854 [Ostrinia nubilalis]|uniref:uncharacterized protein LOC135086854 n=1 Tax=Ostrinia nubilalis TaxID=29057 RepID=UPI0030822463
MTKFIIMCIFVIKYVGPVAVPANDTCKDCLASLFEKRFFPKNGDIPMLNRKVFRATLVPIAEHPYVVSVRRQYAHYLTGTVLTKNTILSVAHPLYRVGTYELAVVVGESYADRGTSLHSVILIIIHEDFDRFTLKADIALLRLYEELSYRVSIKPISLSSSFSPKYGRTAFVTGWGRCDRMGKELCLPRSSRFFRWEKLDPMLRTIKFTMTHSEHCNEYTMHELKMDDKMLCAGPARVDEILCPCMAVPGAPLVVDAKLVGIQSWGFSCGYLRDMPVVYTRLEAYHGWLSHNIPHLRRIHKENLTQLFDATKVKRLTDWLVKSRVRMPFLRKMHSHDLQILPIDHQLSLLRGVVYDIRDFLRRGIYHEAKTAMYNSIRLSTEKVKAMRDNTMMKSNVEVVPFLSNSTLDDIGLVLRNGSLIDEASGEEFDEVEEASITAKFSSSRNISLIDEDSSDESVEVEGTDSTPSLSTIAYDSDESDEN